MTFKDLITLYSWSDVQTALLRLYPDQAKNSAGYQQVFETLLRLPTNPTDMAIVVEPYPDAFSDTTYTTVSGRDATGSYGLEWTDWNQWLGMAIDEQTLATYPPLDILAHCLWEMTFFGYSQADIHQQITTVVDDNRRNGE